MPLCPQITNTPITVTLTADFTVTDVVPVVPATTEDVADVIVLVDGKTKAYYQTTQPTTGMTEGDIWFDTDDGYKLYYYTGTAWVSVQDTAIAAAQSAATAAQTTANGKNKIYRQATSPGTTGNAVGDTWFNTSADNAISRWDGTSWVATSLGNGALASISASKITAGTIDASVITVSNLDAGNITTGFLAAARIQAASIDATKIVAGSITSTQISSSYVYAGTITAGQITAGTLTGFTIQTSSGSDAVILQGASNALSFKVSGTVVGNIVPLSSFGVLTHYGATPDPTGGTFPQMYVGSSNVSMFANASNGISASTSIGVQITGTTSLNNQTNYPGISTGSGSTMVVVTTGSRIAYTTSSERFKQDIVYINTLGWLDKVMAMKPITYKTSVDFTTEGEPNETQYGFLAEDIYDLGGGLEKAVILDPLGEPFSLSYDRLTVFLTLAIKELKAEIDKLKGA